MPLPEARSSRRRLTRGIGPLAALLACACARPEPVPSDPHHATVRVRAVPPDTLLAVLRSPPREHWERVRRLEDLFHGVGCDLLEERSFTGSPIPNVVCTLRGETESVIVVGASLDRPQPPRGPLENWSGATLLPALYFALDAEERQHTFEFVAFSSAPRRWTSGRALWPRKFYVAGSERFARGRSEDVRAMVNLHALGLGETAAWESRAHDDLWLDLASVARSMDLPLRGSNPADPFPTHADPFQVEGVPSITIHSYGGSPASRTAVDSHDLGPIDPDRYVRTFRLVAAYLAYLDQSLAAREPREDP